ncbi:MAG: AAA family ATPase, partial [Anaerolineae bacterium]|nr:AAA family ATPase [Anaerolineae bacterium]
IDEAYMLTDASRGNFGREALDTLLTRMENNRNRLVVIFAGYPERMRKFRESNPGLPRRIPERNIINFPDFSEQALHTILISYFSRSKFQVSPEADEKLQRIITEMIRQKDETFGNAGEMRNLYEAITRFWAIRHINDNEPTARYKIETEDIPPAYIKYIENQQISAATLSEFFDGLVGMDTIREAFEQLSNQIEYQRLVKQLHPEESQMMIRPQHMAFLGNPGTGKTTMARKVGEFYAQAGILRKGHSIEVTRVDLVGEYVGHTAPKVMEQIRKALDGVLFIDEAYALMPRGHTDFAHEAIEMLVKAMEDYRDRLVIIFAGYTVEMEQFLQTNAGLASRIPLVIKFPDFRQDQLGQILGDLAQSSGFILPDQVRQTAERILVRKKQQAGLAFGNARTVRNLFSVMQNRLSKRVLELDHAILEQDPSLLFKFTPEDLPIRLERTVS